MSVNGYVDWPDVAPPESGGTEKVEYLRLRSGQKYKIRPVHKPVHFFKYFYRNEKGELRTAICEDPDTCPVGASHDDLGSPSSRYAIHVFDRADGKLKVMEGPKTVFLPFRQRFEVTGKDPAGSTTGGDWAVDIQGTGKATKYTLTYIEDTPLNKDEITAVQEQGVVESGDQDGRLKIIYKSHSPEIIEKRLFAETLNDNQSSDNVESSSEQSSSDQSQNFTMNW
ncbi:hypothetical protein LCGC14_1212590 [marine sediment metagenome]|uniref:Uncharacterized protein n=1 Tax=marine sediment metagenome TaxID=412755 RepID=A0A0F9NVY2_9ZZZZ|nr:hypothetical protein [Candidatus Aminicenantes bacterium]